MGNRPHTVINAIAIWLYLTLLQRICIADESLEAVEVDVSARIQSASLVEDSELLEATLSPLRPVEDLDDIESLLLTDGPKRNSTKSVMLLLVYDNECRHCADLLVTMEDAWWKVDEAINSPSNEYRSPVFGKMDIALAGKEVVMDMLGVDRVPTLLFVIGNVRNGKLFSYTQPYIGKSQTSLEIFETVMHAWYSNLLARGQPTLLKNDYGLLQPRNCSDMADCVQFFKDHAQYYLRRTSVTPDLPSTLTQEESQYAHWLFADETGDDFSLMVQCRLQNDVTAAGEGEGIDESLPELYSAYDSILDVTSSMRDSLMLSTSDCPVDGAVVAYRVARDSSPSLDNWDTELPSMQFIPTGNEDPVLLKSFMVQALSPSIMWFDRQSTGPIAFPRNRKLHATLFVDLHRIPDMSQIPSHAMHQKELIQKFRRICQQHRRSNTRIENDLVCLVVPSIEHRVLSTFGVDLWTALDEEATMATGTPEHVLPSLLITDGRGTTGLRRYQLPYGDLLKTTSIDMFFDRFWNGELQPHVKTSSGKVTKNEAGVSLLTSATATAELVGRRYDHSLIMFTSDTCGHCKRFSVLWNQLSSLLRDIGWDSFLQLYQFNVDTDDIPLSWNVTVRWVPDVYYLPPPEEDGDHSELLWQRHDWVDVLGNGVGKTNTAVEIIDWLVHSGAFPDEMLQKLLDGLPDTDENEEDNTSKTD